jgi:hypothetical protein
MESNQDRILQVVAATLIDARCLLEDIETLSSDLNELHGEITRAHALCSQIMASARHTEPEFAHLFHASA